MSNRTDPSNTIHSMNPQNILPFILRSKILDSFYWKTSCFALTSTTLIDRAITLNYVGNTCNNVPTSFICLMLKMLMIIPEKEIILEYLKNWDFKYIRILAAFYLRLTANPIDIYQYLEPLYNDFRKIRVRNLNDFEITTIDAIIDLLLHEENVYGIQLPRLPKRSTIEAIYGLEPRISELDDLELQSALRIEHEPVQSSESIDNRHDRKDRNRSKSKDKYRSDRHRSRSHDRKINDSHRSRDESDNRSRYRDSERHRSRNRHGSKDRNHSRDRRDDRQRSRDRAGVKDKEPDAKKAKLNEPVDKYAEENALRAKLGMKPLKD